MRFNKYLLFLLVIVFTSTVSCHKYAVRHKQSKAMRATEKRQKEAEEKKQKEYEAAVKKHASHQSKRTKKMMKATYKNAQRYNYNKKEFFLKRWFRKKPKTAPSTPKQE